MAGNFQHLRFQSEKFPRRRFLNKEVRLGRFDFQFEPKVSKEVWIGDHRRGRGMTANLAAEATPNRGNVLDVVNVPVSQQEQFELDFLRRQPLSGTLRRIEQDPALWRGNQVAICLKNPAAEGFVLHCVSLNEGVCPGQPCSGLTRYPSQVAIPRKILNVLGVSLSLMLTWRVLGVIRLLLGTKSANVEAALFS